MIKQRSIELKKLRLENFKSFEQAELTLGPLTVLLGANATGKSNIREAFRFLHGVGLGYSLADIFGEKSVGGEKVWDGIRGGTQEAAFTGHSQFQIGLELNYYQEEGLRPIPLIYQVKIQIGGNGHPPRIASESLVSNGQPIFTATAEAFPATLTGHIRVELSGNQSIAELGQPILNQIGRKLKLREPLPLQKQQIIDALRDYLAEMRFIELLPAKMRAPSFPGQSLGDQGENLSSALQTLYQQPDLKEIILDWLHELTPMDVVDFEFTPDQIGRVSLTLVEADQRKTSIYSASDGTLRFLAVLATVLTPEPASLYFFEELENGIHPTRLYLVSQLLQQRAETKSTQIVVSTHSPYLLNFFKRPALQYTSLLYRLEGQSQTGIQAIVEIPDAQRLIEKEGVLRLHESGWFEDAVFFNGDHDDKIAASIMEPDY